MQNLGKSQMDNGYDEKDPNKLRVANALSTFTNPPIICIPLFLIICIVLASNGNPFSGGSFNWGLFIKCELISLIFASILPMAIIVYWAKRIDTDKDISNREDRFAPLIIGTISYLIGFVISLFLDVHPFLTVLLLCYTVNTLIVMIITSQWKISIHTTGLTGPIAALIMLLGGFGAVLGIIYPALIWSRVTLKKHTMAQAIAGGVFGYVFTVGESYLYMKLLGFSVSNLVGIKECFWIILGLIACPIILGICGLLEKRGIESIIRRKLFHLLAFLGFAIFYFYAPFSATLSLVLISIASILVTVYAGDAFSWHRGIDRKQEKEDLSILLSLACGIAWIIMAMNLFTVESAILSTLIVAFVGAIAEPVAVMFANHKFDMKSLLGNDGNKSIESSVVALIITMVILLLFTQNVFVSIAVGLAVCLIETFVPKELENFVIPFVCAIILGFLLHY
ncbi:MAG: hypothetical protein IKV87_04370 [Methanobrevibacter sp.]|nr:hypothetical protein [Methanobrevibacter sp.]